MQSSISKRLIIGAFVLTQLFVATVAIAEELPEFLYSKGGVIYPRTGDSTQEIFRTPPKVKDYLKPGMLVGVLPNDCKSASRGTIGEYYICDFEFYLKPVESGGETVYRVIDIN
jgi:hypothetical protein